MKSILKSIVNIVIFILLTVLTQVGGFAFLCSELIAKALKIQMKFKSSVLFLLVYSVFTFILIPTLAPIFGREKVKNSEKIKPTTYLTILLNRNYVRSEMNDLLAAVESNLKGNAINISYLDANFPFINKFPLLPHLSHNDGKKIDLSFIYETKEGLISDKQKSNSGYGVFVFPKKDEPNQIGECFDKGFYQYDYPKYLTLGATNSDLIFSSKGTKQLMKAILASSLLGKVFIEPHLKERLKLTDNRIRYQGCRSVRHDDHIHIQLK